MKAHWIVDRETNVDQVQASLTAAGITNYELYFAKNADTESNLEMRDHFQLARTLVDSDAPYAAIFDRGVALGADFKAQLSQMDPILTSASWDIIYLDVKTTAASKASGAHSIVRQPQEWSRAYLLSRAGAEKITEYVSILPPGLVITHELAVVGLIPDFIAFYVKDAIAAAAQPQSAAVAQAQPQPQPVPKNLNMVIEKELTERQRIKKQVLEQVPSDVPDATVEQLVDNIMKQKAATAPAPVPLVAPAPAPVQQDPVANERAKIREQVLAQIPSDVPKETVDQLVENIMRQRAAQAPAPAPVPAPAVVPVVDERQKVREQVLAQVPSGFPAASVDELVDNIMKQKAAAASAPVAQSPTPAPQVQPPPQEYNRFKLLCINKETRPDLKLEFIQQMHNSQIDSYEFVPAVENVKETPELNMMLQNNTFGFSYGDAAKRDLVAKAMTHIGIWGRLAADPGADFYVVFEDSARPTLNFKDKLISLIRGIIQMPNWGVLWLGYGGASAAYRDQDTKQLRLQPLDRVQRKDGTFAYIISKAGAQAHVAAIKANGIRQTLDDLLANPFAGELMHLELMPHIVLA